MNAIVIYKSNTGFTKKYAEWIAEALGCKVIPIENFKSIKLDMYDTLVFGGWFFAGNIQGFKEIKNAILNFKGKKAIFATGATPANAPAASQAISNVLTEEEHIQIGAFYLQGGLNYSEMGFMHKSMMKMICNMMKKQHGIDSEEYKTISQSFDATDKSLIDPIITYLTE